MTPDVSTIVNLGIGGFAIWIMYLILKSFQASTEKKDSQHSQVLKEKDEQLIVEIDKRDKRLEDHEKSFREYASKVHDAATQQINENTKALKDSARIMQEVTMHLAQNRPVIIQNNTGEQK